MRTAALIVLMVSWFSWGYPFIFHKPHRERRKSVVRLWPTRAGLVLEGIAIFVAFAFRLPPNSPPGMARVVASVLLGPASAVLAFTAVRHLGSQFRIYAGLYEDHELVRTGPYALVRHPIYTSLLAILLATLLLLTPWPWVAFALACFLAGTEIRVHSEDALLASRFGEEYTAYRRAVRAYVPFIR